MLQHSVLSCKVCARTYSFYTAQCSCLQGAVVHYAANQARNTEANPLLVLSVSSLMCITQHRSNSVLSHPKDEASFLSVVIKDTGVTTGTRTHTLLKRNTRAQVRCSEKPLGHGTPHIDWSTMLTVFCERDKSATKRRETNDFDLFELSSL